MVWVKSEITDSFCEDENKLVRFTGFLGVKVTRPIAIFFSFQLSSLDASRYWRHSDAGGTASVHPLDVCTSGTESGT